MNGRKYKTQLIFGVCCSLWGILNLVRAAVDMPTPVFAALSVLAWLPLIVLACITLVEAVVRQIAKLKHWHRRRKNDRRIIAQSKAIGVWDKQPIVLGGRALELKAREDFKIKREPGEPDANMRRRYMEKHDELDAFADVVRATTSGALEIPPEILYGGSEKDKQDKGESTNE